MSEYDNIVSGLQEIYDLRNKHIDSFEFVCDYLLFSSMIDVSVLSSLFILLKVNDEYRIMFNQYTVLDKVGSVPLLLSDNELLMYKSIFQSKIIVPYYNEYISYITDCLNYPKTYVTNKDPIVYLKYNSIRFKQFLASSAMKSISQTISYLFVAAIKRKVHIMNNVDKLIFENNRNFILWRLNMYFNFGTFAQFSRGVFTAKYKVSLYNIEASKTYSEMEQAKSIFYSEMELLLPAPRHLAEVAIGMDLETLIKEYKDITDEIDFLVSELNLTWFNMNYLIKTIEYFKSVTFKQFVIDRIASSTTSILDIKSSDLSKYKDKATKGYMFYQAVYTDHLQTYQDVNYKSNIKNLLNATADLDEMLIPASTNINIPSLIVYPPLITKSTIVIPLYQQIKSFITKIDPNIFIFTGLGSAMVYGTYLYYKKKVYTKNSMKRKVLKSPEELEEIKKKMIEDINSR